MSIKQVYHFTLRHDVDIFNKQSFILFILIILHFIIPITLSAQQSNIKPHYNSKIRSGCEYDYPPYCIVSSDSIADGYSVELLRTVLNTMGYDVSFKTGYWNDIYNGLIKGRFQVLPLVGKTPEREKIFDFSLPYLRAHGAIVVRKDESGINNLDDLKGKHVSAMDGDYAEEFARRYISGAQIIATSTFEHALRDLSNNKCDAVIIQKLVALQLLKTINLSNLKLIEEPLTDFEQRFCFAVNKGNSKLLSILNEGLAISMADGTFDQLYTKWFLPIEAPQYTKSRIVVGGDEDYPPYEFLDKNNQPAGYNVELTRAIAKQLGIDVEIRLGPWAEIRDGLEKNEIDIVQGMFYSWQRDKTFEFSPLHTAIDHVIVTTHKNVNFDTLTLESLANKTIVAMKGDIMHDLAVEKGYNSQLILANTQEEALKLIAEEKYDYAIVARTPALYWIKKNQWYNLRVSKQTVLSAEYCYAALEDKRAILARFSEGLVILKENGEYRNIYTKWLGIYEQSFSDLWVYTKYILFIMIPVIAIIILLLLWSHTLKRTVQQKTKELKKEIKDRIKIQKHLTDEKELLSVTLGSIGDAVITTDTNCNIVIMNNVAQILTGYSITEAKNRPLLDILNIIDEQSKEPCKNPAKTIIETGKTIELSNNTLLVSSDKTESLISCSGAPIKDSVNETIGAVLVFRDITEKQKLLEAFHHTSKLKSLGVLAGGIAHDFNNILGAIIGYSEISLDEVPSENKILKNNISQILKASDRAKQLINEILSFSRNGEDVKSSTMLKPIIDEALHMLRASIDSSIIIKTNIAKDSSTILCNSTQIHEIIMNLGTNAVYAMNGKGTLEITHEENYIEESLPGRVGVSHPGLYSIITFKDSGSGMNKSVQEHIFEPFYTTKPVGKGVGMGLAMVFGIVLNHNGNIIVQSEPGQGTKFSIFLPKSGERQFKNNAPKDDDIVKGNERILLVDDEKVLCLIIKEMLVSLGYSVSAFTDSLEALNTFKSLPFNFDLVITDQTMPAISGIELSKELIKIRNDIPVILCTGYNTTEEVQKACKTSIKSFCMKPFRKIEIAKKIRELLDNKGNF